MMMMMMMTMTGIHELFDIRLIAHAISTRLILVAEI